MFPISGLYEVAIRVKSLPRAEGGLAVKGPVCHDWIPARSVYFAGPDGHDLELCAPAAR